MPSCPQKKHGAGPSFTGWCETGARLQKRSPRNLISPHIRSGIIYKLSLLSCAIHPPPAFSSLFDNSVSAPPSKIDMSQQPMNDVLSGTYVPFQDVYDAVTRRLAETRMAERDESTRNTMQTLPGLAALEGAASRSKSEEQGSKRYAVAALV